MVVNTCLIYDILGCDDLVKRVFCFMIFIFLLAFCIMSYLIN